MGLTVFFTLFFSFSFVSLWLFIVAALLVLFRRKKINYKDHVRNQSATFLSPVNGFIFDVQKDFEVSGQNYTAIRFTIPHFSEWGLHMPHDSEIEEVSVFNGQKFVRYRSKFPNLTGTDYKHVNIVTKSKNGQLCILKVLTCAIGFKPKVWLEPGDRGRASSCFGFFPLGGTVVMMIPNDFDVVINKHDKVVAGQTVIAGFNKG